MKEKFNFAAVAENMSDIQLASLLTGKDFWTTREYPELGIPSVRFADGPNGLRVQDGADDNFGLEKSIQSTCFPCSCAAACSWDRELMRAIGERLGQEADCLGVNVLLGPGVNIKRNPLCGRNFEYFSEDPYLAGELAAEYVRGVQSTGTACCVKHFAANNREFARTVTDSRVSERALREIYLVPFETAVKDGGVRAVMTAYNKLNGEYCSENKRLITDILRGEWGFGGIVLSDWVGTSDRIKGIAAGEDLEMPRCPLSVEQVSAALKDGTLPRAYAESCAARIADFARSCKASRLPFDAEEHLSFARKAAESCAVLLKNDGTLPLKKGETVAVIGALAENPHIQGSGSAKVNCYAADDVLSCLKEKFSVCGFEKGYRRDGRRSRKLARRAVKLAAEAQRVIFFAGLSESEDSEGADRADMSLPLCQRELLSMLYDAGVSPVVVLCAGGAVDTYWDAGASAVLDMYLCGAGTGGAVASLLCGEANPCGKLAETFVYGYKDVPCSGSYGANPYACEYKEDVLVGYRYYDVADIPVKYPFGHGLSYTVFEYSNLSADSGGVRFTLKNSGEAGGAETAQLYICPPDCGFVFPVRQLKGFKKIYLQAGESREVFIPFDGRTFRTYDDKSGKWRIYAGEYVAEIGSSSRDIRLKTKFSVQGERAENAGGGAALNEAVLKSVASDAAERFEESGIKGRAVIDLKSPLAELSRAKGAAARMFYRIVNFYCTRKKNTALLTFRYITVRSAAQYAGFNAAQTQGFIDICNGRFFRGLKSLITKK